MFVGLTGGIACGKSLVAQYFQELGARIIDADALAHQLLEPGQPGYEAVVAAFGPAILNPRKAQDPARINRARLAEIVFADPAQRARLEAILHPMIFVEAARRRAAMEAADPGVLIVFVAPLLYETGSDRWVERTIAVVADEETQVVRMMARDGVTRAAAELRLRAQMAVDEKRRRADYGIDGARPPDDVRRQVSAIVERLAGSR